MLATIVEYIVEVVDGECLPVPGLEIGARYHYPTAPASWDCAVTDGDGIAKFYDEHPEDPVEVVLFVGDKQYGTFELTDRAHLTIEL